MTPKIPSRLILTIDRTFEHECIVTETRYEDGGDMTVMVPLDASVPNLLPTPERKRASFRSIFQRERINS